MLQDQSLAIVKAQRIHLYCPDVKSLIEVYISIKSILYNPATGKMLAKKVTLIYDPQRVLRRIDMGSMGFG